MRKIRIRAFMTALILLFCQVMMLVKPENIKADTRERNVESQPVYGEYALSWVKKSDFNWDMLMGITKGENTVAEYSYDVNNNRSSKYIDGKNTYFVYSEDGRLLSVSGDTTAIVYLYKYDEDLEKYFLLGFEYCGQRYEFGFNGGIIDSIMQENEIIAKYVYTDTGEFVSTLSLSEEGVWVENQGSGFIGNINKLRLNQSYYDDETGWYYNRRYYDAEEGRYVDGISFDRAMEMLNREGAEEAGSILSRVYSLGIFQGRNSSIQSRSTSEENELDVVTRTIYGEAGTERADWYAVAWVIYNRIQNAAFEGSTAYAIVTAAEQFSAYWDKSDQYLRPDTTTDKWSKCLDNAVRLINGQTPGESVNYITNHVYFRSVTSFTLGYDLSGTDPVFKGDLICDMAVPGVCYIETNLSKWDMNNKYSVYIGKCNIYFNYIYK